MSRLEHWYGSDAPRPAAPQLPPIGAERLIAAWLDSLSEDTIKAYRSDLEAWAAFVGASDVEAGAKLLLSKSCGEANVLALEFRNAQRKRGLAPASTNRRLAALRSFTKAARQTGLIPWVLEVKRLQAQPYRDTRGPGADGFRNMLGVLKRRTDAKGARDRAILRLLYERALREGEVCGLDLADVDLAQGTIKVLGKMRTEKELLSLAPSTVDSLREWIQVRGNEPGPLFTRLQESFGPGRLSRQGVYRMVRELGEELGIRARPHGLRHAAVTEALDRGADVRTVQRFSRHKSLNTLTVYDDNRRDLARDVACLIASDDPRPRSQKGEANKRAKLTEEKVLEIRRRAVNETQTSLAREFGISQAQVYLIVRRRSWAHVGGD